MASIVTSFSSLDQITTAFSTLKSSFSIEGALTWAQAAFDRVNMQIPSAYIYVSDTKVTARFASGDTATVYGNNLIGSTRYMTKLDYHFSGGTDVTLLGSVSKTASGSMSGNITQTTVSKVGLGSTTLYGNSDVAGSAVALSKVVWDNNGVHCEENGSGTGFIWTSGGYYHASVEGVTSSLTLTLAGRSLNISGLSYPSDSESTGFANIGSVLGSLLAGDDTLTSTGNEAALFGFGGADMLNGGAKTDTAIYFGPRTNYTFTQTASGYSITDNVGNDGTDTLTAIERLQFSDRKLAIDFDTVDGNAAKTAKLLGVVFGASSVAGQPYSKQYVGIGLACLDSGWSYEYLMGVALNAAGATTHAAVVNLLWTNLFGSAPTAAQAAPFVDMLDNGSYSPGSLGVMAADLDVNMNNIQLVGLAQTGIEYI